MATNTTIETFWKCNPQYWITPPEKHAAVDALIHQRFFAFAYQDENLLGRVIYRDQFSRHFARHGAISEEEVELRRRVALSDIYANESQLESMDETEIVFCLMVFKHLRYYNAIFSFLHEKWLKGRNVCDFPVLQKFYLDTYKKAYTYDAVKSAIILPDAHSHGVTYDPANICDSYPPMYANGASTWVTHIHQQCLPPHTFTSLYAIRDPVFVSLSGGVDSMTMIAVLKLSGTPVRAIHVLYGNRAESEEEYALLTEYCARLDVPLYVYRIPYIRRTNVDRTFYEAITRDLRFWVYQACAEIVGWPARVLLGHIQDDVVENIWTNIARGQHLDHLPKMLPVEEQQGVTILRPLLSYTKDIIYATSHAFSIPYLKNTTPAWCNRGKFRNHFHQATVDQYGSTIDKQMIAFAESVGNTYGIVNDLLYAPIYGSWRDRTLNIRPALQTRLDVSHWIQIFTHVCHTLLGIRRPSIKAIQHFHERIYHPSFQRSRQLNVLMGTNFMVRVKGEQMTFDTV